MGLAATSQSIVQGVYDTHNSLTPFMSRIVSHGQEEGIREGQLKGRGWECMLRYWDCTVPWRWVVVVSWVSLGTLVEPGLKLARSKEDSEESNPKYKH